MQWSSPQQPTLLLASPSRRSNSSKPHTQISHTAQRIWYMVPKPFANGPINLGKYKRRRSLLIYTLGILTSLLDLKTINTTLGIRNCRKIFLVMKIPAIYLLNHEWTRPVLSSNLASPS